MESSLGSKSRVYQTITDRIIEAIEVGAGDFVMPWHQTSPGRGRPENATTGKSYRGANIVALWAESMLAGFNSCYWASYRQWQGVGAQVRQGERGSVIVFYKMLGPDENEKDSGRGKPLFARASRIFNADQVDGWHPATPELLGLTRDVPQANMFIGSTGASIALGFSHAAYNRTRDRIEVPARQCFIETPTRTATEAYYATVLHELVHWSGAPHRLDRTFGKSFGDAAYAAEELVAEIGASFLCADLAITNEPRADHAAYVDHWLRILGQDARAIFTAARLAQNAALYLHGNTLPGDR